ncbi:SDR family NAD(P)-dependent oxidoreductase [Kutzneria sp. CA-103260]|uniref:SDR family NAD(P)-dependent oxidoreductase n=1 Tax=Kutzneria sp. CA-103260 TaxID=2802641 RepID=UPI001BA45406|nr:SDR family oxidoreductase [Kutzneria sp. CA-103260]QUQ67377.1 3-oxoacyl-ACP reductase [Kutzneria sp. CA-103260]
MSEQRIALVTGASRGIGRSAAFALARRGVKVVLTYREGSAGADEAVRMIEAAGGDAFALPLDISDAESFGAFTAELLDALRRRWGTTKLDILVNNAGIGLFGLLEDVTIESFDALVGTNFRGTFFLVQALAPHIADGGRVINVSTSMTRHVSPGTSVYAASKAAVEAFSRSLAVELGQRNIRVNAVAPGPSATDFNGGAMRDDVELRGTLAARTALGRVGKPEEIGDAIAAIASSADLRWVTAERLEVSGGALL